VNLRSCVVAAVAGLSLSASAQSTAQFVDTSSYLTSEADINAWYSITSTLKQNFDDVCGDTFCEGDYSNIESLRFRCSVNSRTGVIGECVWVFAASNEEINPATGAVTVETETWTCKAPLAPRTTIRAFLTALSSSSSPINAPLPRTTTSLYDGLVDCL
jgi:hypothetical protein